jgi:DNA polymerase I
MERLHFWLLDLNYEVRSERPEMWLWGVTEDGHRVLLIDDRRWPRFYLLPREDADVESLRAQVAAQGKRLKDFVAARVVERRWQGRPRRVLEVQTRAVDAAAMGRLAQALRKVPGIESSLEDDIRWSVQYLLDCQLTPSAWWVCSVEPLEGLDRPVAEAGLRVGRVVAGDPELVDETRPPPDLRFVAWGMLPWQAEGIMVPERDPVVIIGLYDGRTCYVQTGEERDLLEQFLQMWSHLQPDVVFGYGVNRWDWTYLLERCHRHGLTLAVGRDGSEPHPSLYGHISLTGRANVDILDFASEIAEVKLETLEGVARYLGLTVDFEEWDDWTWAQRWRQDPTAARQWFEQRLRTLWRVSQEFWHYAVELSRLTGIPLDQVGPAAAGFRVEHFLLREARRVGELAPKRGEQPYGSYVGGYVLEPRLGIHENVAVLDFKSMYPSLMLLYNISPDTYVPPSEKVPTDEVFQAPTTGHRFRKQPDGVYRTVLRRLLQARQAVKERRRTLPPDDPHARLLAAQEKAVKVITNAVYGYAGWPGARWYARPVAEAVADWGRWTIRQAIEWAGELGLTVIYGDTDSLFVVYDPDRVQALIDRIRSRLQMDIELEQVYRRILFTEAKKRYAGLTQAGTLDIAGLEVVRGDWAPVAQEIQEAVLTAVLRDQDVDRAVRLVRSAIQDLRAGRMDWRKLVIWKTLTKRPDEYKANTPHVAAAQILLERGHRLTAGHKVGYVVLRGAGPLYRRVAPYPFVPTDRIDVEYYVQNQVVPAAGRILNVLGVSESQLLP